MRDDQTTSRPADASPPKRKRPGLPGPMGISALELYPMREAQRRLRWGRKTMTKAQRDGLRVVAYGREKYVSGREVLRFFKALESDQAGDRRPPADSGSAGEQEA